MVDRMLTRRQLMQLGREILSEGDPEQLRELIEEFDRNVPHPAASDLFLFPELAFGDRPPTLEDIVDEALRYTDPVLSTWCPAQRRTRRRSVRQRARRG
jgi:hypothetical protein